MKEPENKIKKVFTDEEWMHIDDDRPAVISLLNNIRSRMDELEALLEECNSHWYEDMVYRFYHHSFKVYNIQYSTGKIAAALRALIPDAVMTEMFMQIINDGTNKTWSVNDNANWQAATRPILEAFFHARYFLEMAIKYGKTLERTPALMPSGWAALLELYNLR